MPSLLSSETVASLMPGSSTCCAQPVSKATRPRFCALAALCTPGLANGDAAGTLVGASFSMAASGFSVLLFSNSPKKGRPSLASFSAARKRAGCGSTKASTERINRSASGRL